jgi:alkylhydroperoxidase family enzyme
MNYRTPAAQEQGLGEATARNLTAAAPDASLTQAEKAAADFAERLALNHQSIDDHVLDGLRHHFTEQQIVELGWAAAAFIGFGRLIHVFGGRWESGVDVTGILPKREA